MITFPDSEPVHAALQRYFDHYGFVNGGYGDKWFIIKFRGPLALKLPNIKNRVEAVKLHDIHHILTEYEANLRGETEIGAWEIGAGCGKYWSAWLLNAGALAYGIFFWPGRIYRAFMRGRQSISLCRHTLYQYDEKLLTASVGHLRQELHTGRQRRKISLLDNILFSLVAAGILAGYAVFIWLAVILFRAMVSLF